MQVRVLLLCFLVLVPSVAAYPRNLSYSFTVRNRTSRVVTGIELTTFAPAPFTRHQGAVTIVSEPPCAVETDEVGNQVLVFTLGPLAPYASHVVRVRAVVEVLEEAREVAAAAVEAYRTPERFVESGAPEVVALSGRLDRGEERRTARAVYRWVRDEIRPSGYAKNVRGALWALRRRRGDCSESACLVAALCRARGMAARVVGGYVAEMDGVLEARAFHDWAEFWCEGQWHVADAPGRVFGKWETRYIITRIHRWGDGAGRGCFHRFRLACPVAGEAVVVR